jgi:hypothetical protein
LEAAIADRLRGRAQMIRVMVTVNPIEHFNAHAQKSGGFPFVDASLHEPSRGCVTQSVRPDPAIELREPHSALECRLY